MNQRQIGYIEISSFLLEEFWMNNKSFIPLDIVQQVHKDNIRYLCYSEEFKILDKGDLIPTYELTFKRDKKGIGKLIEVKEHEN